METWFDPPNKSYLTKDYAIDMATRAHLQWGSIIEGPAQTKICYKRKLEI